MCEQNEPLEESNVEKDNGEIETAEKAEEETREEDVPEEKADDTPPVAPEEKKSGRAKRIILRILLVIGIVLLSLLLVGAITLFIMYHIGEKKLKPEPPKLVPATDSSININDDEVTIEYKGENYVFDEDKIVFVVMGVDKESIYEEVGAGDNGQADVVFLVVADTADGSVDMVSVSRDVMVDVNRYTTTGNSNGVEKMQLCLAYAYGYDNDSSCQNVLTSVSRLFYGIPISGYVAIDLEAIAILTDSVGGVSVPEYTEDGSAKTGATVTLTGETAERYLRRRQTEKLDSNNARMERQSYYLNSFISKAVSLTKKDLGTPLRIYNGLTDYMLTDITASDVVYLAAKYLGGVENMTRHSVKGSVVEGEDGKAEFIVDTAAMDELILTLFYEKK